MPKQTIPQMVEMLVKNFKEKNIQTDVLNAPSIIILTPDTQDVVDLFKVLKGIFKNED